MVIPRPLPYKCCAVVLTLDAVQSEMLTASQNKPEVIERRHFQTDSAQACIAASVFRVRLEGGCSPVFGSRDGNKDSGVERGTVQWEGAVHQDLFPPPPFLFIPHLS
jgi:hypothetical protein